jgi:hypothetical protein
MEGANIMRIIRLFLFFFMLAHWVGCFWFVIGHRTYFAVTDGICDYGIEEHVHGNTFAD